MKFFTAKIKKDSGLWGLRLLDLDTYDVYDIKYSEIVSNFDEYSIENMVKTPNMAEKFGEESLFPVLNFGEMKPFTVPSIVVLYQMPDGGFACTNGSKQVIEIKYEDLEGKFNNRIANKKYYDFIKRKNSLDIRDASYKFGNTYRGERFDKLSISTDKFIESINLDSSYFIDDDVEHSIYSTETIHNIYRSGLDTAIMQCDTLINANIQNMYICGNLELKTGALKGCKIENLFVLGNLNVFDSSIADCSIGTIYVHGILNVETYNFIINSRLGRICVDREVKHLGNSAILQKFDNNINFEINTATSSPDSKIISGSDNDAIRIVNNVIPQALKQSGKWIVTVERFDRREPEIRFTHGVDGYAMIIKISENSNIAVLKSFVNIPYTGDVEVPEGVSSILSFPRINEYNINIKTLTINNDFTFNNYSMAGVNIDKLVVNGSVLRFEYKSFDSSHTREVEVRDRVGEVAIEAFNNAANLEKFTFGISVETVLGKAFYGCKKLENFDLQNTGSIRPYSFFGTALAEKWKNNGVGYEVFVEQDGVNNEVKIVAPAEFNGAIEIPEGATSLRPGLFYKASLSECILPKSFKKLGDATFMGSDIQKITFKGKVREIPRECFYGAEKFDTIDFSNISTIANSAFAGTALKEVKLYPGIKFVGISAFEKCNMLEKVEFPDTMEEVRSRGFCGCKKLSEVVGLENLVYVREWGFCGCALKNIRFGDKFKKLQNYSFSESDIETVDVNEGCEECANALATRNPVTYTFRGLNTIVSPSLLKKTDTVNCLHGAHVVPIANTVGCTVKYIDEAEVDTLTMKKTKLITDVSTRMKKLINDIYNNPDADFNYTLKNAGLLVNNKMSSELKNKFGIKFDAAPANYKEKAKFEFLLDYLSTVTDSCLTGMSNDVLKLEDTIDVSIERFIYNDGVSRITEFMIKDSKYESRYMKYIVATTGDCVRYACLNNVYTNICCNSKYQKSLVTLTKMITPKSTLSVSPIIGDSTFPNVYEFIKIDNSNVKKSIFNAYYESAIVVKLDRLMFLMMLPIDNVIMQCQAFGQSTLSDSDNVDDLQRGCTVLSIQSLDNNNIISKKCRGNYKEAGLLPVLRHTSDADIKNRMEEYKNIGHSVVSTYKQFSDYCNSINAHRIEDLDVGGLGNILSLPVIEQRDRTWYNANVKKGILTDTAKHSIVLKDGTRITQKSSKKALHIKNPLMIAGERAVYTFDITFANGAKSQNVFLCMKSIDELFKTCIFDTSKQYKQVYSNKTSFDRVSINDVVIIRPIYSNSKFGLQKGGMSDKVFFVVYKGNGLFYIAYVNWDVDFINNSQVLLLVQAGDFDVVSDYLKCASSYNTSGAQIIKNAASFAIDKVKGYNQKTKADYDALLEARALTIEGKKSIKEYVESGIPSNLAYLFGVFDPAYVPKKNKQSYTEYEEDVEDYFEDGYDNDDADIEIKDEDIDVADEDIFITDDDTIIVTKTNGTDEDVLIFDNEPEDAESVGSNNEFDVDDIDIDDDFLIDDFDDSDDVEETSDEDAAYIAQMLRKNS